MFPKLTDRQRNELAAIVPSIDGDTEYYPCRVRLKSGDEVARVFIVSEEPYLNKWGIYPSADKDKREVRLDDVIEIRESPCRLPPRFANQLYAAGESGMGYCIFTVVFGDASRQAYLTGNAVDFIEYPEGKQPGDVVSVEPHEGRDSAYWTAPAYSWCLHSE